MFSTGTGRFLERREGDRDSSKGALGAEEDRPKRRQCGGKCHLLGLPQVLHTISPPPCPLGLSPTGSSDLAPLARCPWKGLWKKAECPGFFPVLLVPASLTLPAGKGCWPITPNTQ